MQWLIDNGECPHIFFPIAHFCSPSTSIYMLLSIALSLSSTLSIIIIYRIYLSLSHTLSLTLSAQCMLFERLRRSTFVTWWRSLVQSGPEWPSCPRFWPCLRTPTTSIDSPPSSLSMLVSVCVCVCVCVCVQDTSKLQCMTRTGRDRKRVLVYTYYTYM